MNAGPRDIPINAEAARASTSTSAGGRARACTKHGRKACVLCLIQTAIFPVEHFLWARILGPLLGVTF